MVTTQDVKTMSTGLLCQFFDAAFTELARRHEVKELIGDTKISYWKDYLLKHGRASAALWFVRVMECHLYEAVNYVNSI